MDVVQGYSSNSDEENKVSKSSPKREKERNSDRKSPSRSSKDSHRTRRKRSPSRSPERSRRDDRRRTYPSSKYSRPDKDRRRRRSRSSSRSRSRSHSPIERRRRSRSKERRRHRSRSRSRSPKRRGSYRRRSRSRSPPWASQRGGSRSSVTRAVLPSSKELGGHDALGLKKRVLTTEEVEQKLAKHMLSMQNKASEEAKNSNLPSYLNPAMVNARQFKQQQEKKRLLWSSKKQQDPCDTASSQWNAASLSSGTFEDQATAEKYKRFMGIKGDMAVEGATDRSKELLDNLEREYEKSRVFQLSRGAGGTTGIGLGFGAMDKP